MIRRMAVRPEPDTGEVSRQAMREALLDAEAVLFAAGGVLTVVVDRRATDVPGEAATVFALLEWKDRTDARPAPEATVAAPAPAPAPAAPEAAVERKPAEGLVADDIGDGLDPSTLEYEDLSEIPEPLR